MVDALRRAHTLLTRDGCVVDLHPTAARADVEVGETTLGRVTGGDAPARHAAAGAALDTVVEQGLFVVDAAAEFPFFTYGDTIDELRAYIHENWRDARIDDATVARARRALRNMSGVRPRVREHVAIAKLRPVDVREVERSLRERAAGGLDGT